MKIFLLLICITLFYSCGKQSFSEEVVYKIKFKYKNNKVEFITLTSSIAKLDKGLNNQTSTRLTITFSLRNASNTSLEVDSKDFKIYLSEDETYSGSLFRTADDIKKSGILKDENIIPGESNANFYIIYWLPYSTPEKIYKDIKWQINSDEKSNIDISLNPTNREESVNNNIKNRTEVSEPSKEYISNDIKRMISNIPSWDYRYCLTTFMGTSGAFRDVVTTDIDIIKREATDSVQITEQQNIQVRIKGIRDRYDVIYTLPVSFRYSRRENFDVTKEFVFKKISGVWKGYISDDARGTYDQRWKKRLLRF